MLFSLLVTSVTLVLLAGTFDEVRSPGRVSAMPPITVAILATAASTLLLTIVFQAVCLFGTRVDAVPKLMLGFVAMLATACALLTVGEMIGIGRGDFIRVGHPAMLVVAGVTYTCLAIWLAWIFDVEARAAALREMFRDAHEREQLHREQRREQWVSPRQTMEM
ncbi:MAG: hypothetical protein ABI467_09615 [Kofleriaceae bacterium]